MTDEKAMLAYSHGDMEAFNYLFNQHRGRVQAYIAKRIRDPEQRNEAFQEVFLKLHKSRGQYDAKHEFVKWLYVIARTTLVDCIRRWGRSKEVTGMSDGQLDAELNAEAKVWNDQGGFDLEVLNNEKLSEQQRTALKMRYQEDAEFKEIALSIGTSEANVRKIISRGLKVLHQLLNKPKPGGNQ